MSEQQDTPLVLADGVEINPKTGMPTNISDIYGVAPEHSPDDQSAFDDEEVDEELLRGARESSYVQRQIHELPENGAKMHAIALVFSYHMFGLANGDIATLVGIKPEQVAIILKSNPFEELYGVVAERVETSDRNYVRSVLDKGSKQAAHKVVKLSRSKDKHISLSAAKDVLDRAGHRPADVVEHRHRFEDSLVIEHVTRDTAARDIPEVEFIDGELEVSDGQ